MVKKNSLSLGLLGMFWFCYYCFFLLYLGKQHQIHYIIETGFLTLKNNRLFSDTDNISSEKRNQKRFTQPMFALPFLLQNRQTVSEIKRMQKTSPVEDWPLCVSAE